MRISAAAVVITFMLASYFVPRSFAGEAVFCVSEENRYIVLAGKGEKCLEEETEMKISGGGIEASEGLLPLATFATNEACGEGTAGMRTDVGLDSNSNGKLEPSEILSTLSFCRAMHADAE
ncbi:MAG TPA: hypothetical protein VJV40_02505 [Thermodesulfobacteriota bacterium]|nr:hypothetical protein [Thermodesulfobacteriota bacterium]